MRRKRLFVVLGCAVVLIAAGVAVWCLHRPELPYRVTFLPAMGGVRMNAHAINDSGRVAASVRMADGTTRVVLWDKSGRTQEIATFPEGHSVATVVLNNAGQVACTIYDPNHTWRSFFWDTDGRQYLLNAPADGQPQIRAINNAGRVVGHWSPVKGPRHAFLWDKTIGMIDLGVFGGTESVACDINDWGQIVGFFSKGNRDWRAFVSDPNLGMQELGPTHCDEGMCCINNQGLVVGQFGSTQAGLCVSTWTARTGPQQLALQGGDFLQICGLNDANRYFLNTHYSGRSFLRQRLWERWESHLWESGRSVRQLGHTAGEGIVGIDMTKDGTILGAMANEPQTHPHFMILEPIE